MKKIIFAFVFLFFVNTTGNFLYAQCSMCSISAEQGTKNGNTQGKGLNSGIIYLLVIPYLLITSTGILWYRNYRKKNSQTKLSTHF